MRNVSVCLALATVLTAVPAFAETITYPSAQVSISVPENWKSIKKGDVVTLADRSDDVAVAFALVPAGAVREASKIAGNALRSKIQNLTFKKEEKVNINGMSGVAFEGDGLLNGINIDLAVLVLDTPSNDKDLFVFALAEDAKLAAHKPEVKYVFRNIAPSN